MRAAFAALLLAVPANAQPAWVPRGAVELVGTDKVNVRTTALSGPVGQPIPFGSLTIVAKSCVVRPADQIADAAAFLDITDSRPGPVAFHAWLVRSAPAVSIFEHPVYDIRLVGCR